MNWMHIDRLLRRGLILVALATLCLGLVMWGIGSGVGANWIWALGTVPVAAGLLISMGRIGVDAIAFVSMSAALLLGETLIADGLDDAESSAAVELIIEANQVVARRIVCARRRLARSELSSSMIGQSGRSSPSHASTKRVSTRA